MEEDDVVGRLRELGLTAYQSRAYVAAVRLGSARPNELASAADIPQARIYDVIDDLADLSFVEVHEQSGGKVVSAPPPSAVLESYKQRHIDEYSRIVDFLTSALGDSYGGDRRHEGGVTLVGMRESALRHSRRAIDEAEFWVSLSLSAATYDQLEPTIEAALDRGVTVRLLSSEAATTDRAFPPSLRVRSHDGLDTLVVADRDYGVLGAEFYDGVESDFVVSQERGLSTLFQDYFEWCWWSAEHVTGTERFPRRYLDPWRLALDLGDRLDGDSFAATVTGVESASGRTGEWTGAVVDWSVGPARDSTVVPERARLTIDTADGRLTVGDPKDDRADLLARGLELDERPAARQ